MRLAIAALDVDTSERNVWLIHHFVTGAAQCDSEALSVGRSDNVDMSVFDPFDYVALGHIHGPRQMNRPSVRYCGTPLKYSFSEAGHQKSLTMVELGPKSMMSVRTVPLFPKRNLLELRRTYYELTFRGFYEGASYQEDYIYISHTVEEDVPDAVRKLQIIYPI